MKPYAISSVTLIKRKYQKKYSASDNKDVRQTSHDPKAWFNRELRERFKTEKT